MLNPSGKKKKRKRGGSKTSFTPERNTRREKERGGDRLASPEIAGGGTSPEGRGSAQYDLGGALEGIDQILS